MHMHEEKTPAMREPTICPTCRSPSCTRPWCTNRAPPPALCVSSTNTTAEPELDALLPLLLLLLLLLLLSLLYRWPWSPICTDRQAGVADKDLEDLLCGCDRQGLWASRPLRPYQVKYLVARRA